MNPKRRSIILFAIALAVLLTVIALGFFFHQRNQGRTATENERLELSSRVQQLENDLERQKEENAKLAHERNILYEGLKILINQPGFSKRIKEALEEGCKIVGPAENRKLGKQLPSKSAVSDQSTTETGRENLYRPDYPDRREVDALADKYLSSNNYDEMAEALDDISELDCNSDSLVLDIIAEAVTDLSPDLAEAGLNALSKQPPDEVMDLWALAMNSTFPDARSKALKLMSELDLDMESLKLILRALNDPSEEVRVDALLVADDKEEGSWQQRAIFKAALISRYGDTRIEALDLVGMQDDKFSVQVIVDTLPKPADPEYVECAVETLSFMLGEDFETASEALGWWRQNESNYDDKMLLVQQ